MDPVGLIDKYYHDQPALHDLLLRHSRQVAQLALRIVDSHPLLQADRSFVYEAAMLHDIGILLTDAPSIHCHGTRPYIQHGIAGAELLRREGLPRHARVAERHTGAGLTLSDILAQQLPLPHQDYLPESIEEQIVCYADKFYSKSHPEREKPLPKVLKSIAKHGPEALQRFQQWHERFCVT